MKTIALFLNSFYFTTSQCITFFGRSSSWFSNHYFSAILLISSLVLILLKLLLLPSAGYILWTGVNDSNFTFILLLMNMGYFRT